VDKYFAAPSCGINGHGPAQFNLILSVKLRPVYVSALRVYRWIVADRIPDVMMYETIDAGTGGGAGWSDSRERTVTLKETRTMSIDLKPEQQRVIDLAVRSGAYENPGEVLDQAFEIIREQLDLEDWMFEQREAIAAHIETGFAQAERGESIDGDAAVEMLRQRRAERLKPQE
jgi:Arc/MetJ-type ribon-helix-helix transcriptional regulator